MARYIFWLDNFLWPDDLLWLYIMLNVLCLYNVLWVDNFHGHEVSLYSIIFVISIHIC